MKTAHDDYDAFVDKFKPKKTTDDCYTPPDVYDAILQWVTCEYEIHGRPIVRPFWPGGDYQNETYPADCVVVDNPPFSILSKICRWYLEHDIDFFLFAPYLTNFSADLPVNHVITDTTIEYENGAKVNTSFLTTLGGDFIRAAPTLASVIKRVQDARRPKRLRYAYPPEVLTVSRLGRLASYGVDLRIGRDEVHRITRLDSQQPHRKAIYGNGYLMSARAAERLATAERQAATGPDYIWELSDRERRIIDTLDNHSNEITA